MRRAKQETPGAARRDVDFVDKLRSSSSANAVRSAWNKVQGA
jgi:hypothetical protein